MSEEMRMQAILEPQFCNDASTHIWSPAALLWFSIPPELAPISLGASQQTRGAFLYGGGADTTSPGIGAYEPSIAGMSTKASSFGIKSLKSDSWTNLAEPSAGIVFRF